MGIYNDIAIKIDSICDNIAGVVKEYKRAEARKKLMNEIETTNSIRYHIGQLKVCNERCESDIRIQARQINEGRMKGFPTQQQEAILRDTIISYLMVRESIFYLESAASLNNISTAYNILNSATRQLSRIDNTIKLPKPGKVRKEAAKQSAGAESAEKMAKRHSALAETIFQPILDGKPLEASILAAAGNTSGGSGMYAKDDELSSFLNSAAENEMNSASFLGSFQDKF